MLMITKMNPVAVLMVSMVLCWGSGGCTEGCQLTVNNEACNFTHLFQTVQRQLKQLKETVDKLPVTYPRSCAEVKELRPNCHSGYFKIQTADDEGGNDKTVYCNMDELCGDSGGWMRVGYLNMSDPSEQCPPGFRPYEENGIRACGRIDRTAGCQSSVTFPSHNINYTQVCGRVTGYQKGSPDGLYDRLNSYINQPYVDGVSITRGNPRKHIWTFIAGLNENTFAEYGEHECPCAPNSPVTPQAFIGNDYFCESGNPGIFNKTKLYTNDPLWDGKQCGLMEELCCNVTGIPWFNKVLEQPTTDYIELRVCGDDANMDDEDVPVGYYEIYVK